MALEVYRSLEKCAAALRGRRTVVTVGNFDGVHLGHQKIVRRVVERAHKPSDLGRVALAVTFDPHPLRVLRPAEAPPLIHTVEQRLAAIAALGLDAVLILRFDRRFAGLAPTDFVRKILFEKLRTNIVVVGENFRFGHRHAGEVSLLQALGKQWGFEVELVPPVRVRGQVVSSSAIRRAIGGGKVELAARLLGRPYALTGEIQSGTGRGSQLVVPTLNLDFEQEILPCPGVYITETLVEGKVYRSATNVGVRPTFNNRRRRVTVESHLFDFSADVKKGQMEVRFWRRLRDERKFSGVAALRHQIARDLARARRFFERLDIRAGSGQRA